MVCLKRFFPAPSALDRLIRFHLVVKHVLIRRCGMEAQEHPQLRHPCKEIEVKVLVINAGSSSLKFTMFRMTGRKMLAKGIVERIGLAKPNLQYETSNGHRFQQQVDVNTSNDALTLICEKLVDPEVGVLEDLSEVEAIGHRVVHGGERFTNPVIVNPEVKNIIRMCASLAPLHNPPNLGGIEACERVFPGTPNVAVFDTAFHQTMPPSSYLFAVPYELYEKHGIRKYGFHGTSHKYIYLRTSDYLSIPADKIKLITCHLGNGCSITAIDGGKVIDTSMGLTPLMGLVMGTRCGDIDAGVLLYLLRDNGMSLEQVDTMLNKRSGLLGVSGIGSSDMRDILSATEEGVDRAEKALKMFVQRLVFYIGAYNTLLSGADAVVFTGGIGENCPSVRADIIEKLGVIGCCLDAETNDQPKVSGTISTSDSRVKALVLPTNEELMIALESTHVLGRDF